MKIIGKQGKDYIVVLSEFQICQLMGFESMYTDGWEDMLKKYGKDYNRQADLTGATLDITGVIIKAGKIRKNEDVAKKAIFALRGLADSLEIAYPEFIKLEDK